MSAQSIAALGALFTGIASVITATLSNRSTRRKGVDECEKRISEIRKAFKEGFTLKSKIEKEEDKWSGLP